MTATDRQWIDKWSSEDLDLWLKLHDACAAATVAAMVIRSRVPHVDDAAEEWATACDLTPDQLKEGAARRILELLVLPFVQGAGDDGSGHRMWEGACKRLAYYVEVIARENIRPDNPGSAVPPGWQPDGRAPASSLVTDNR